MKNFMRTYMSERYCASLVQKKNSKEVPLSFPWAYVLHSSDNFFEDLGEVVISATGSTFSVFRPWRPNSIYLFHRKYFGKST